MNKKKKGFISTALVYSFLVLFMFLMLAILRSYVEKDKYLEAINAQINEDISYNKLSNNSILSKLLEDNTPQESKFSTSRIANYVDGNGNGLFYSSSFEGLDSSKKVFFFRGSVDNNHLVFANLCFRIVRVEADGSTRIRYNGVFRNSKCSTERDNEDVSIGSTSFSVDDISVSYINKIDNRIPEYDESATRSPIIEVLNNWYLRNIVESGNDKLVSRDTPFCGDTQIVRTTSNYKYYSAYNLIPKLTGESFENSVNPICSTYSASNNTLAYPVGLLSADEIVLAGGYLTDPVIDEYDGGDNGITNESYFLYNPSSTWTISPYSTSVSNSYGNAIYMDQNGTLKGDSVSSIHGVIPVIALNASVKVSRGSGTSTNPYRVE